jgi:hypothetical protein
VSFFKNIVDAANAVNSNVWAFIAMMVGVVLSCHKIVIGDSLIVGGFAILRSGDSDEKKDA